MSTVLLEKSLPTKERKKNRKITWRFHISHREFDNYNLEVSGKKSNCCIKRCIKLDGFCKSLHKIGFVWNEAVWLVILVNTYNTPTYACLLDGCHRMVLPCSPLSLSSVNSLFLPVSLPFPSFSCTTSYWRLLLPASSPFPPVEKEQINKTNKRHFLCTRVVMFSCFHRLEIIRFSHVHLLSLKSLVICFWGRGGSFSFLDWQWVSATMCLTGKNSSHKELAAE